MKNATPAQKKLGFQIHALAFVLGLVVLIVINLMTGPPYWVLWVVLGWGVGLLMHGLFGLKAPAGKSGGPPLKSAVRPLSPGLHGDKHV